MVLTSSHFKKSIYETMDLMKLFDLITSSSHDGIYVCDHQGQTLMINDGLLRITNISKEMFFTYSLFELVEMNILPNSCSTETIQTKRQNNTIIDYYNGTKALLTSTPVLDDQGEIVCVVANVRDITELIRLEKELEKSNQKLIEYKKKLDNNASLSENDELIFMNKRMMEIVMMAEKLADNDSPILILGESGVGKDVLSKHIHKKSGRKGDFVRINCGAIPEHLLESELFGYEKGAFTGANTAKKGLFEAAHKGTIFLDEIGDLPYHLQVKLLNVLQEKKIRRLGSTKDQEIDMRVISATNIDLNQHIKNQKFRRDLYYRLNVLTLIIPPLKERQEDISALTFYFLNKLEKKYGYRKTLAVDVLDILLSYEWPGNIRELNNIIQRMYHMSDDEVISTKFIPKYILEHIPENQTEWKEDNLSIDKGIPLKEATSLFERDYILKTLKSTNTLRECADELNIDISTLVRKKKKLKID